MGGALECWRSRWDNIKLSQIFNVIKEWWNEHSWVHLWLFCWKYLNSLWTGLDFFPFGFQYMRYFRSGFSSVMGNGRQQWKVNGVSVNFRHQARPVALEEITVSASGFPRLFYYLVTLCWWALQCRSVYTEDFKCLLHALTFPLPSPSKTRLSKAIGHLFLKKP